MHIVCKMWSTIQHRTLIYSICILRFLWTVCPGCLLFPILFLIFYQYCNDFKKFIPMFVEYLLISINTFLFKALLYVYPKVYPLLKKRLFLYSPWNLLFYTNNPYHNHNVSFSVLYNIIHVSLFNLFRIQNYFCLFFQQSWLYL